MSVQENKAIVRRFWEEGWNQQNPDWFDELMDEQYAAFECDCSAEVWAAYPDTHFDLPEMIAEGDRVVSALSGPARTLASSGVSRRLERRSPSTQCSSIAWSMGVSSGTGDSGWLICCRGISSWGWSPRSHHNSPDPQTFRGSIPFRSADSFRVRLLHDEH